MKHVSQALWTGHRGNRSDHLLGYGVVARTEPATSAPEELPFAQRFHSDQASQDQSLSSGHERTAHATYPRVEIGSTYRVGWSDQEWRYGRPLKRQVGWLV